MKVFVLTNRDLAALETLSPRQILERWPRLARGEMESEEKAIVARERAGRLVTAGRAARGATEGSG